VTAWKIVFTKQKLYIFAIAIGLIILSAIVYAAPVQRDTLTIETTTIKKIFTSQQLLADKRVEKINLLNSRAYPHTLMKFNAIKLCDLLRPFHVHYQDMIELIAIDDFVAVVPASKILSCHPNQAIAMLAIESLTHPWPKLKYNNSNQNHPDEGTAGPYQVIWLHPEKSYISNEYWAWKVNKIKIHKRAEDAIDLPRPTVKNKHIQNGYHMYVSHCMACHTLHHIGKAKIGPDLSKNTFETFENDEKLRKFIRDPQSVRPKNNDRMSGTDESSLSNTDLNDLILYLHG